VGDSRNIVCSSSSSSSSWRSSASSSCSVFRCRWSAILARELLRDMFTFLDSLSSCLNSASILSGDSGRRTLISSNIDEMAKKFRLSKKESESLLLDNCRTRHTFAESII